MIENVAYVFFQDVLKNLNANPLNKTKGQTTSPLKRIPKESIRPAYLSLGEAAEFLGYSPNYLYKLSSKGKIPCHKPNGGKLFFDKKELEQWVKQGHPAIETEINDRAADYLLRNRKHSKKKKGK